MAKAAAPLGRSRHQACNPLRGRARHIGWLMGAHHDPTSPCVARVAPKVSQTHPRPSHALPRLLFAKGGNHESPIDHAHCPSGHRCHERLRFIASFIEAPGDPSQRRRPHDFSRSLRSTARGAPAVLGREAGGPDSSRRDRWSALTFERTQKASRRLRDRCTVRPCCLRDGSTSPCRAPGRAEALGAFRKRLRRSPRSDARPGRGRPRPSRERRSRVRRRTTGALRCPAFNGPSDRRGGHGSAASVHSRRRHT
jgi:hypothetical protein